LIFISAFRHCCSQQSLSGYSVESNVVQSLDGSSSYNSNILLSLTVPTCTSADSVLLVVNMNVLATSGKQAAAFTIFRDSLDLAPSGTMMVIIDPFASSESQSATFSFMDYPGTIGTFTYTVRGKNYGVVSSASQKRQLAAIVTSTHPARRKTLTSEVDISSASYQTIGLQETITTTATFDRVLVSAFFSLYPTDTNSAAKVSLYRNSVQVEGNDMQKIRMQYPGDERLFTMFYLDMPGSAGDVVYSVSPALFSGSFDDFEICNGGESVAHLNLLGVSSAYTGSLSASDIVFVDATQYTQVGLTVAISPLSTTDKLLVTVNINFRPTAAESRAAFTIFRGTTNLGDSNVGLQVIKMASSGINAPGTLTFLDTPATTSIVTYTVQVKNLESGKSFHVSHDNQVRQIAVIVMPAGTAAPTPMPSGQPSSQPSAQPSRQPTAQPSSQPTAQPTNQPNARPSAQPSSQPSRRPTAQPSAAPTSQPSRQPSFRPTAIPTAPPSPQPSNRPSAVPSSQPSSQPSCVPTSRPSASPSTQPSGQPSTTPSTQPSTHPSSQPSPQPVSRPTSRPSTQPNSWPTVQPTVQPTEQPSAQPSVAPTEQPSVQPSEAPTGQPSLQLLAQSSAHPTVEPSAQPTDRPSRQPSSRPSTQPSAGPTSRPSCWPTMQPSGQPSLQPSSQPSGRPSSVPTRHPSTQPTAGPSGTPTSRSSGQHTARPSLRPSGKLSVQPSSVPSGQPSSQPSSRPMAHPSSQPSEKPSSSPTSGPSSFGTGEWARAEQSSSLFKVLSFVNGSIWACGAGTRASTTSASCTVVGAATGESIAQHSFPWDEVVSAQEPQSGHKVVVSGRSTSDTGAVNSHIATCEIVSAQLAYTVRSYHHTHFVEASYNAHRQTLVHVGSISGIPAVSLFDPRNQGTRHLTYAVVPVGSLTLSHVSSPPNFVGSFFAGTSVGSTGAATKYIVAGWLRADTGQMATAIGITPLSGGRIVSDVNLVTAMALESTGPDSFMAGGLQLNDGARQCMYIVRANAMYQMVQYGMRYIPTQQHNIRSSPVSNIHSSVARGVALVDKTLFVIGDVEAETSQQHDYTSLAILKLQTSTGSIIKQALVSAPTGDLLCTDIILADLLLVVACTVQRNSSTLQSVLIAMDMELTLFKLPPGFTKHGTGTFQAEALPMKITSFAATTSTVHVPMNNSESIHTSQRPSPQPTIALSVAPTELTTACPSAQPTSRPTSVPSISAQPSGRPSTSGPTSSRKPSTAATERPTVAPSALSTQRPSPAPTITPTASLTGQPTVRPSVARPGSSVRPSRVPTAHPTLRAVSPTTTPTTEDAGTSSAGRRSDSTSYAIAASVGGAVCLGLCGLHVLYRRKLHSARAKVAAGKSTRPAPAEHESHDVRVPVWLTPSDISDAERDIPVLRALSHSSSSAHSSSLNVSSLHTSERSANA